MLAGNDSTGLSARRKRPVISCRECHRRKEKCDRRQPCSRCVKRGHRDNCLYELNGNTIPAMLRSSNQQRKSSVDISQNCPDTRSAVSTAVQDDFKLLGYANDTKGTPGIIRSLGETPNFSRKSSSSKESAASQYANIIRELPPRRHMNMLVQAFFKSVAWHYDIVDEAIFSSQFLEWSCLSHHQLKLAPDGISSGLRSFPALLFQVLAQALLFQPEKNDEILDDLKSTADMELSDRAAEYSDAGHRLASSFSKTDVNITLVRAGLMRACFEKTTGAVIEAWHTLGSAIRNAQELGLHLLKPEPTHSPRTEGSDQSEGRSLWFNLHLWDAHMAVVLGRPMMTRMNPKDVPLPAPWNCSSGAPRPPQSRDVILCGYHTAYKFLQDIHDLEHMDDCQLLVENMHQSLLTNITNLPAWATAQRSRQNEPPWISAALEIMSTNIHFVVFALHRPFIFTDSNSRSRAFNSAMQILNSQARLFNQTEPLQYKSFTLVYATFDAMVLIAAIHIQFPAEFADHLPSSKENLWWALDRLNLLRSSNKLASSAFSVVQGLYAKMLAVAAWPQTPRSLQSDVEENGFAQTEVDMSQIDWDGILGPYPEIILPAQPLSQLLYNAPLDLGSVEPPEPFYG